MKLYIGENKRESKEVSIGEALTHFLKEGGFHVEMDSFDDESAGWVNVKQTTLDEDKWPRHEITVELSTTADHKTINELSVYVAPIEPNYEKEVKIL